jgi:hypothetical protein
MGYKKRSRCAISARGREHGECTALFSTQAGQRLAPNLTSQKDHNHHCG